ncbi:MAG: lipoyl synthase, partial [Candidatus Omnitrophota bacterium]|nr:lipoyl synthase [Candidatus Omnitrophota bacterium]
MTQSISSKTHLKRFPYWLRQPVRDNQGLRETKEVISELKLNTVCQSSRCPNIYDCFSGRRCTFLILGKYCTRHCRFCSVEKDKARMEAPDRKELFRIRDAVYRLGIKNPVITSVTRDDLEDGGAGHFADCVIILRDSSAALKIEVLVPDFLGRKKSIEKVVSAKPDIFSHNLETAPRLYKKVRQEADYNRSLQALKFAKEIDKAMLTKSGIMAGFGESREEIYEVMKD